MIDLNPEFGPALQPSGGKVKVNGMTEVRHSSCGGAVDLGLTLLQTRQNLPSPSGVETKLAEQSRL